MPPVKEVKKGSNEKKGPLRKGTVREAIDSRIESNRKRQERTPSSLKLAVLKGKEMVLQELRKDLFGERLPR